MSFTDADEPVAHIRFDDPDSLDEKPAFHTLADHLDAVGERAAQEARMFGNDDWARLAGQWHDLGKYNPDFQRYIHAVSQPEGRREALELHIEDDSKPQRVDHATVGAIHAIRHFEAMGQAGMGRVLAWLIGCHHTGLVDWFGEKSLNDRLQSDKKRALYEGVLRHIPAERLTAVTPQSGPPRGVYKPSDLAASLWVRMLFSCLVDADFLDTEAFKRPDAASARGAYPAIETLLALLDAHMAHLSAKSEPSEVNRIRADVLRACIQNAALAPGLFSLTVPTGGGKTLASMAFAMRHALTHGQRRVIYVIPYTSIIEQTAAVFKTVFGEANVIEHHSNFDPNKETAQSRTACENWDAPIIVTTSVQFFESLFAVRTSRVRKLHNIARSVVILDEAQLLPLEFLKPVLEVLRELTHAYGVSVVFSTATQPAFRQRDLEQAGIESRQLKGFDDIRELAPNPSALYQQLKRVRVELPPDFQTLRSWDELAQDLAAQRQVLCVVSKRRDCRELFRLMPPESVHLSALMCGQHRSDVIARIRQALANDEPIRVISTQLVEAGVDLDFPVVYRAMAGLDSIAQAAGRCNREGKLSMGRVVAFNAPSAPPPGILLKALQAAVRALQQPIDDDPLSLAMFPHYFRHLFAQVSDFDAKQILPDLRGLEFQFAFRSAARKFKLIEDGETASVLVPYGQGVELIETLKRFGPSRERLRAAQRYIVTLYKPELDALLRRQDVREAHPGIFIAEDVLYDPDLGLLTQESDILRDSRSMVV